MTEPHHKVIVEIDGSRIDVFHPRGTLPYQVQTRYMPDGTRVTIKTHTHSDKVLSEIVITQAHTHNANRVVDLLNNHRKNQNKATALGVVAALVVVGTIILLQQWPVW